MPIKITNQDITKIECDAIVNATNVDLLPVGDGIDAAIHAAAGEKLAKACMDIGGVNVGEAVITDAFGLPCKHVIHTAGPVWDKYEVWKEERLESCYISSLSLALKYNCESVAIPLISYNNDVYPKYKILRSAMNTIGDFLIDNEMTVYLAVNDKTPHEYSPQMYSNIIYYMDMRGKDLVNTVSSAKAKDALENLERQRREREERFMREEEELFKRSEEKRCVEAEQNKNDGAKKDTKFFCRAFPQAASPSAYHNESNFHAKIGEERGEILAPMIDDFRFKLDKSFAELLFLFIDKSGMSDVECYKRANVDRKTFSKIKCNKDYRPSKPTALSFAIALELNLRETNMLLQTLGMTLSRSIEFDVIVQYFIERRIYDINLINETLFEFDQLLLGS